MYDSAAPRLLARVLLCLVIGLLASVGPPRAQAQAIELDRLEAIESSLRELEPLNGPTLGALRTAVPAIDSVCALASLAPLHHALSVMSQVVAGEQRLNASASFALRDNQASGRQGTDTQGNQERQTVEAGISVRRGLYPLEVNLQSSLSITRTETQEIQEDISSLFLSVDRHLNSTRFETFAFLQRVSDDFLNIDQRYESGGGVVLNLWLGRTRTGARVDQRLRHGATRATPGDSLLYDLQGRGGWVPCFEAVQGYLAGASTYTVPDSTLEDLRAARDVAAKVVEKRHHQLRLSLLGGFFGELEQASVDAFMVNNRGWRVELRPRLAWQPLEGLRVQGDWFLKYRIGGFEAPSTVTAPIERDGGLVTQVGQDVRTELDLSIRARVRGVDLVLRHLRLRDFLPPFVVVDGQPLRNAEGVPVAASWKRNLTTFEVSIPL
ncbi:MAG: hypothetical protein AAGI71_06205 [Bacteroidota bacterium]